MSDEKIEDGMKYPHNVLEGFGNGCITDFRFRFAMDLVKAFGLTDGDPDLIASHALAVSAELFEQGEKLGWIKPLPDDAELNRALRMQAKRTARFQVMQQVEGNKFAQEESSKIHPAGPVTINH